VNKFWNYIKGVFEGGDGQLSLRRLISFVMVWLIAHMVVKEKIHTQFQLSALYSIEITMLLLISVITVDNLLTFFKSNPNDKK